MIILIFFIIKLLLNFQKNDFDDKNIALTLLIDNKVIV